MKREQKLDILRERLASFEASLKTATIPQAAKGYKDAIRRIKREIAKLEQGR